MSINYRPEIDGLRAISVIAVLIYHSDLTIFGKYFFNGGFIGVDIFFLISGYLIGSIIINELSPLLRDVVNYNTKKPVQPKKLYEVELQNFFIESINLTGIKDTKYKQAIEEIDVIVNLIDDQLSNQD